MIYNAASASGRPTTIYRVVKRITDPNIWSERTIVIIIIIIINGGAKAERYAYNSLSGEKRDRSWYTSDRAKDLYT